MQQTRSVLKTLLFILLAVQLFANPAAAEIPPRYYQSAQDEAPEYLEIHVLEVSKDWYFWRANRMITVRARVEKVHRSAIGLKAAQEITIRYLHKPLPENTVGPRPIPVLQEGVTTPAWLKRSSVNYKDGIILTTAARGYSFDKARH